ncbi:hypothetical protein D3C80_1069220 [compost metagenome]
MEFGLATRRFRQRHRPVARKSARQVGVRRLARPVSTAAGRARHQMPLLAFGREPAVTRSRACCRLYSNRGQSFDHTAGSAAALKSSRSSLVDAFRRRRHHRVSAFVHACWAVDVREDVGCHSRDRLRLMAATRPCAARSRQSGTRPITAVFHAWFINCSPKTPSQGL